MVWRKERPSKKTLRKRFSQWRSRNEIGWLSICIVTGLVSVFVILLTTAYIIDLTEADDRKIIEGLNCQQLAEYIADKKTAYSYAEHRYEWLCVNEKIMEFKE